MHGEIEERPVGRRDQKTGVPCVIGGVGTVKPRVQWKTNTDGEIHMLGGLVLKAANHFRKNRKTLISGYCARYGKINNNQRV